MEISSISNANVLNQAIFNLNNRSGITNIDIAALSEDDAALFGAAKEFEAYFLHMMLRAMRDTVDTSQSLIPRTSAEEIFQDMLDENTARAAAQGGGLGLAQQIFRQMTAYRNLLQEGLVYNGAYGLNDELKIES